MLVNGPASRDSPERNGRQLGFDDEFQLRGLAHEIRKVLREPEVLLECITKGISAVRAEGCPELQRPKGPRVLEGAIDRVLVRIDHVGRRVAEGLAQGIHVTYQQDAARLGDEQPLVRIDRGRVGEFDPVEQVRGRSRGSSRKPVRAIDMEPHAMLAADARDLPKRIHGTGERRAGCRHHRNRHTPVRLVSPEALIERRDIHAPMLVDGDRTNGVRAKTKKLSRSINA